MTKHYQRYTIYCDRRKGTSMGSETKTLCAYFTNFYLSVSNVILDRSISHLLSQDPDPANEISGGNLGGRDVSCGVHSWRSMGGFWGLVGHHNQGP